MEKEKIIKGLPVERAIFSTLGQFLMMILEVHGEKVLQIDAVTGEELTANVILARAVELAKWYREMNIGVGDSVSISSENRLEFNTVSVAAFLVGAAFAPVNPEYTPSELKHVLSLSKPKIIFCSPNTLPKIEKVLPHHKLVVFGKENPHKKNIYMFNDIIKSANGKFAEDFKPTPFDPDETIATILCSSGTTGLPKGVMTTHANITAYIETSSVILSEYLTEYSEVDVTTGLAPFFHSMGFMIMLLNLIGGKTLIVYPKFTPKLFLESISKYKVTTLIVPPPVAMFLLKHPLVKRYDISTIREIRCGAAGMGKQTEEELEERLNLNHMSQSYGMTETTLGVLINPRNAIRHGSVGKVVPGMIAKVIDEEGKSLGPNQEGELCFKGPLIVKGYIGDKSSTSNLIDKNGWLHTGDVGYYTEDEYFYIVDRLKELIKYKGFQVAPAELEAILVSHPCVVDAAVVGLEDEKAGELPIAFVVKKANASVSEKTLENFVAEKVSPQKRLRGGVVFVDEIPRNPTGKILRRVLRQRSKSMKSKM